MDEDVYGRIAPKKPRLWSFHEVQEELRNLTRDRKKRYQPQHKVKKPYAQVHVTAEGGASLKTERTRQPSELSELTEIVKKLALDQQKQMAKLSWLESRMTVTPSVPSTVQSTPVQVRQGSNVTCYHCGKPGHIACVCRAVFHQPQPTTPA